MKNKKFAKMIMLFLFILVFILFPLPNADLYIRINFAEVSGNSCELYYTTATYPDFNPEQYISSDIDYQKNQVTFHLDSSIAKQLQKIRIDLPNSGSVICIKSISVSSAGLIQKYFNACDFFLPENLAYSNDIPEISLATARDRAYLATGTSDPFIVLADNLTSEIKDGISNYTLTRLLICIFVVTVYFITKKNVFSITPEEAV